MAGQAPGAQNPIPLSLAFDPSGVLYLTDDGDGSIDKFATDGRFLGQWGQFGNAPQQLADPVAIAIDPQVTYSLATAFRDQGVHDNGVLPWPANSTGQPPPTTASRWGAAIGPGDDVFVTDPGTAKRVIRFRQAATPPVLGRTVHVRRRVAACW